MFAEKQALGAVWDSKQTKGEERALVPIKTKLVVAVVLEEDFAEISLVRNVNVVWEGGKKLDFNGRLNNSNDKIIGNVMGKES